jgi:hypothetical protein
MVPPSNGKAWIYLDLVNFGKLLILSDQGYYMYIETSSPRVANDKARLESNLITAKQLRCLSFWYHMYGPHVNTLNVRLR